MKLIEKLKGAHERPYVAYKVVGYYSSYQEAKEALNNVHTLDDVYRSWLELHSLDVSPHTMKGYECAYHHVSSTIEQYKTNAWAKSVNKTQFISGLDNDYNGFYTTNAMTYVAIGY